MMGTISNTMQKLGIKLFADGANCDELVRLNALDYIDGFTTNPTLMRQAGVTDYKQFADHMLTKITNKPISFEVLADNLVDMRKQALEIASWGANVNVKIPVTTTKGESTAPIISELVRQNVYVNVTAVFTLEQVKILSRAIGHQGRAIISVFAGRLADAGVDAKVIVGEAVSIVKDLPLVEILWASTRQLYSLFDAASVGCHIITITPDLLKKLDLIGKDLSQYSLETVEMFYQDAVKSGFNIRFQTEELLF